MLVRPDEKVPIARLLTFLAHGERMAHDCAQAQAMLVEDRGAQRFLANQAKQEAMHTLVFQGAIAWLAPKHLGEAPLLKPLEEYRAQLDEALARKDLVETMLAEQVILEGLGEAILSRIEQGLAKERRHLGGCDGFCSTKRKRIMGSGVARSNRRLHEVRSTSKILGDGHSGISD